MASEGNVEKAKQSNPDEYVSSILSLWTWKYEPKVEFLKGLGGGGMSTKKPMQEGYQGSELTI